MTDPSASTLPPKSTPPPTASSSSAPSPKPLRLLFFASAQSATRLSTLSFPLPPASSTPYTLPQLARDLAERFPKLAQVLETSSWAVNEEMVGEEEVEGWVLKGGETVGVLPPVSGG